MPVPSSRTSRRPGPAGAALPLALALGLGLGLAGCQTPGVRNPSGVPVTEMRPDEQGFVGGTGIESQDIAAVSDKMARRILATPTIANATTAPRIVILPVDNQTRFPINKELFTTRIRALLNSATAGRVVFLARDRMAELEQERELQRQGTVTATTDPHPNQFRGADYFLTGTLQGQTTRTTAGVSDYVLYTFQLIDPRTSEILWEDFAEVKRQGLEDAVYR